MHVINPKDATRVPNDQNGRPTKEGDDRNMFVVCGVPNSQGHQNPNMERAFVPWMIAKKPKQHPPGPKTSKPTPNGQARDSKNTNVDAQPSSSTTSSRYEALEVEPNTISLDAGVNNTQIEIAKPPLPKTPKPSNTEPSYSGKFKTNYKKQNHSKPYSKPHTPSIPSFGKSQT